MILLSQHSQEKRFISSRIKNFPYSSLLMRLRLFNLFGLPAIRGFFSKDYILEFFLIKEQSLFVYSVIVINLILSFYYTCILVIMSFTSIKIRPYLLGFSSPIGTILLSSTLRIFILGFG